MVLTLLASGCTTHCLVRGSDLWIRVSDRVKVKVRVSHGLV
jgi:hypothetical protein